MKKTVLTFLYIFILINSFAQKDLKVPVNQTIVLNFIDYVVYAQILTIENRVKPKEDLYYHWYKANDIKVTRGGFEGKLLHGTFTVFYPNRNLKEKGEFRYGLKTGEWKTWRIDGEYCEISNWHNGKRKGTCKVYNTDGALVKESNYKNDTLHGKCIRYDNGCKKVLIYKNGYEKKKKHIRIPFIKSKQNRGESGETGKKGKNNKKDEVNTNQEIKIEKKVKEKKQKKKKIEAPTEMVPPSSEVAPTKTE